MPRLPEAPCCSGPAEAVDTAVHAEVAGLNVALSWGDLHRRVCLSQGQELQWWDGRPGDSAGGVVGTEGPFRDSPKYTS